MINYSFDINETFRNSSKIILEKPSLDSCSIYYFEILKFYFGIVIIFIFMFIIIRKSKTKEKEIILNFMSYALIMITLFMLVQIYS